VRAFDRCVSRAELHDQLSVLPSAVNTQRPEGRASTASAATSGHNARSPPPSPAPLPSLQRQTARRRSELREEAEAAAWHRATSPTTAGAGDWRKNGRGRGGRRGRHGGGRGEGCREACRRKELEESGALRRRQEVCGPLTVLRGEAVWKREGEEGGVYREQRDVGENRRRAGGIA